MFWQNDENGAAAQVRRRIVGDSLDESATAIEEFGDRRPQELDTIGRESLLEVAGGELVRALGNGPRALRACSSDQSIRPSVYTQTWTRGATRKPSGWGLAWVALLPNQWRTSSPLSGSLGVAPTGGKPMKPRSRMKARTPPIAEAVPITTMRAAATSATNPRRGSRRREGG